MKKSKSLIRFVIVCFLLGLLLLSLVISNPNSLSKSVSAEATIQSAWRNAQKSGSYNFSTELVQTTYPAPLLANVGRTASEDYLYIDGQTDLSNGEMLMKLWGASGGPASGENAVEIRVKGDQAYGRSSGEDWQKINNFTNTFAPKQDLLAYLAGAKNISLIGAVQPQPARSDLTQYAFELDGPQLGRFVRDQLEQALIDDGKLPAGLTLGVSDQYLQMTGAGSIWLTSDHLPARLTISAEFPQQENGQRLTVSIKTDFSGFRPVKQAGSPLGAAALAFVSFDWRETGRGTAVVLLALATVLWIVQKRQSKLVYGGVALTTIFTLVFSPLYQSQKVSAFSQEQAARSAEANQLNEKAQTRQDYLASLFTSTWDPHQSAGQPAGPENLPDFAQPAQAAAVVNAGMPEANSAAPATSALDCSTTETTRDTDKDGLTDCQEKNLGTQVNNSDSDSDSLTDGQEVLSLGLDPMKKDSDGDRIFDNLEVAGFSFNGQKWFTDPNNPDSNKDGLTDGMECPALTPESKNSQGCPDTDGDKTPDIFDEDNDGDGVNDRADLSPSVKIEGLSSETPFVLQANSIEPGKDIFVDFQIRPKIPTHLTYAMNVLDWPTGDNEGQVTRLQDTTFATSLSAAQAAADPSSSNGDLRLTPMLEIMMDGEDLPLPRTNPTASLQVSATANGWLAATVHLVQEAGRSTFTVDHNAATSLDEVIIYSGACISATELGRGAEPAYAYTLVDRNSPQTIQARLLSVVDGAHAMLFKEGDQLACLSLGDLPNGKDPDMMIDTAALSAYGISIRDMDNAGTVVAYAPLSMVNDQAGEQRQAFSAQMIYRQNSTKWGNGQHIRLVWLVQLLGDDGFSQTIHVYKDDFTLTGLSLREDHGMNVSVAFEDPKLDLNPNVDENLWQVAQGLQGGFISGRSSNNQRDLTLSKFKQRFDNLNDSGEALTARWAIPAGKVKVLNFTFANQNGLASFPTDQNQQILNQYFLVNGSALSAAPALIFAREEMYRYISLDSPQAQRMNNQVTLVMDKTALPEQTLAAFNLAAFRYAAGSWQTFPMSQYMDLIGANYKQYFVTNPVDYLQPGAVDYNQTLNAMVLVARSNQLSLMNGAVGLVTSGSQVLSNQDQIDRDLELAGAVGGGVGSIYSVVAGLAGDYFQKLANKSAAMQNLPKGSQLTKAALEEIGETVEAYQKAGEEFRGNFANSSAWGYIGAGIGVACVALSIAAAFSGSEAVQYVALALNIVASVYGLVDAIAKLTVNLAIKAATAVTDVVKGAASVIEKASTKSGAIGLIISSAIAVGLFIYQMVASGSAMFSLAFDSALAGLVGQIAVSVLMLVIASIPVVGQLIAAVLAVIDGLIALICQATGASDSENSGIAFVCSGISGMLASVFTYYFYSSVPLVANLKDSDRLGLMDFKPTLTDPDLGFAANNSITYALTVHNQIVLTDPTDPPDVDVPNWKSLAYAWQFKESNLRKAAFVYDLQTTEGDLKATYDSMSSDWQVVPGADQLTLAMNTPLSFSVAAGASGINQPVSLYLTEAYEIPDQECWAFGIIPICYIRSDSTTNHNDLGANIKWDIFPETLGEFYTPAPVDSGYSLAWGRTPAVETGAVFPRMKDFDGDSLLNKTDGGMDPDDSTWDTDNDQLSDPYELAHGSNPQASDSDGDTLNDHEETRLGTDLARSDSDGDGLSDAQELAGWELVYGFDLAGVPLKTWVTSNLLMADADGDLVLDASEKILGTNPNVVSSSMALTYETKIKNLNAASLLLRFSEKSNVTSFVDDSGNDRNVVCSGPQCPVSGVQGVYGNSIQFDGIDDALKISNPPDLAGASFSVAFWAKRNSSGGSQVIVSQQMAQSSQSLTIGFNTNNRFVCGFGGSELASTTAYRDGNWHHWACTFNSADRARAIYLDGSQINRDFPASAYQGTGDLMIGKGAGGVYNGRIDEFGIFNSALSPDMLMAVSEARYATNDSIFHPGDQIGYTGVVTNELNNRTAQGLLWTETNQSFVTSQVPPTTFIVGPTQSQKMTGILAVSNKAPGGPVTINQIAGGQVVDWRSSSNNAELWLKIDESAKMSQFADSSGIQPTRQGVCSGTGCPVSGVNGSRGYAAYFDGVDDSLNVNNSANLKPNFLTIAGWVRPEAIPESGAPVAAKGIGSGGNLWGLDIFGNKPRMMITTVSGGAMACLADQTLSPGAWVHLAGTYDGSAMTVYINGKAVKSCAVASGGGLAGNDHAVSIGSRQSGSGSYDLNFGGWLDDVRIFSKAMTANEINTMFGEAVFALDFDGSSGNGWVQDLSGSGSSTTCGLSSSCPTQDPGMAGYAAKFSGLNYLEVFNPNSNLDLSSGNYTQSAWVYPDDTTDVEGILGYSSGDAAGIPSIQRQGKQLIVGFGTATGWKTFTTGNVLTIGAWNHVAATFDGTTYRVYRNGSEVGSSEFLKDQKPPLNSTLWLGRTSKTGVIYIKNVFVSDEQDGPGDAELCMAWQSAPGKDFTQIWEYDSGEDGKTYSVNQTLTFTETGALKMWEDDGGTYCGKAQDSTDDFIWSTTFNAYDSQITSEKVFGWDQSKDSTGKTTLGNNSVPITPTLKLNSNPFTGKMDTVRIYRYAMTAEDVNLLYQSGTLPLVMHLDDPSGAGLSLQGYSNSIDPTNKSNGLCAWTNTCPITGVPGRISSAAQFDGVDDFIEIPNIARMNTQYLSASAWVKPNAWTATTMGGAVLSSADTSSGNKGYTLSISSTGKPSFGVAVGGAWCEATAPSALTLGSWAHLAGSFDGSKVLIYVNGIQQGSLACAGSIVYSTTKQNLGRNPSFPSSLLNGTIDEVRIYNGSLAASEIAAQYKAAPVLMLHFDEKTNANGFSNDATAGKATCASGAVCPSAGGKGQMRLAATFDGMNDGIEVPDSLALRASTLTAAAWVKAASWTPSVKDGVILAKAGTGAGNQGYSLSVGNNGQASFAVAVGGAWCQAVSQPVVALGSWTHLAGSYDGATALLYVNGALQSSATCSGPITHSTTTLTLGQSPAFPASHFNGAIDEVTLNASVLSNQEIKSLYAMQAKYVEDQVESSIIIDNTAPVSMLKSIAPGDNYRPFKPQVLGITASDDRSGVAMVEINVCSEAGCFWSVAEACMNAAGSSWCPIFQPPSEGVYQLRTRATDSSGLREHPTKHSTIFVDGTPPSLRLDLPGGMILPVSYSAVLIAWVVHFSGTAQDPEIPAGPGGSVVKNVWVTLVDQNGETAGPGEQNALVSGESWQIDYVLGKKQSGTYTLYLTAGDFVKNNTRQAPLVLEINLDADAPQVNLDLNNLPNTLLPPGTEISGLVTEPVNGNGTAFGIDRVDMAFLPATTALYNDVQPPDGVIRYFPFDDQLNTQAELQIVDLAAGENGSCVNAANCPATGPEAHQGTGLKFDGMDDALDLGSNISLANSSFSLSIWAQRTTFNTDMLIEQGTSADGLGLEIGFRSNNQFYCGFYADSLGSNDSYRDTGWHHWACTYNVADSTLSIYRDGAQIATSQMKGNYQGTGPVIVGRGLENKSYFGGTLDDLYFFNRALNPEEIYALYARVGGGPAQPAQILAFENQPAFGNRMFDQGAWRLLAGPSDQANKAVAGKVGSFALNLDGLDDAVLIEHQPALNFDNLSIAGWVKPNGSLNDGTPLAVKGIAGQGEVWSLDFIGNSPRLWFNKNNVLYSCQAATPLVLHEWTHVAGMYDGAAIRLYLNGVLSNTCDAAAGNLAWNNEAISIAARQRSPGSFDLGFNGAIDDLRLYRRAISAEEVNELFYTGWQPARLSESGPAVLNTSLTVIIPPGLEGNYRLALRTQDLGGNFDTSQSAAWSGSLDTLAPRAALVRTYPTSDTTLYQITAEDFYLDEAGLEFSACNLAPQFQPYQSTWYLAMTGNKNPQANRVKAACTVVGNDTQPVSAAVCDLNANCANLTLSSSEQFMNSLPLEGAEPAPVLLAEAAAEIVINNPPDQAVFITDALPVTMDGVFNTPGSARDLTITVDSAPLLSQSWVVEDAITTFAWTADWSPASAGAHVIVANASDYAGNTVSATRTFFVDTDMPEVTLTTTPYDIWYNANGGVEIDGKVTDAAGIASVVMDVSGPVSTDNIEAVVNGEDWTASWHLPADAPVNGVEYTFTVRATDLAGNVKTLVVPKFVVDLTQPLVTISSVQIDGVEAQPGQVISEPAVTAAFTFSASDNSAIKTIKYAWTSKPAVPAADDPGLTTLPAPGSDPISIVMPLAVSDETGALRRYLYVEATDTYNTSNYEFWGPLYQDPEKTPDYVGMDELGGPYSGGPYREWMKNSCTTLGTDNRTLDQVDVGNVLHIAQNLFATWDHQNLRLTWTGANWDNSGDLFIYLDTVSGGSYLTANPYPATQDQTILLLPATTPESAFFADYAVWVKDSKTAVLLKWNQDLTSWEVGLDIPLTEQDGDWGYHFSPEGPGYTDLSLPFTEIGVADPLSGAMGLVAFASEEDALRPWSVMPPANHVNSALVTHLAPGIGEPSLMQLTEQYALSLGDGVCQQPQGRLQFEISANPGGLNFSSTNDDIHLLIPHNNPALFDPFDDGYQNWLDTVFCPVSYWYPACRANKNLSAYEIMDALATFTQVDFPPVAPGQSIEYAIRYNNDSPAAYTDILAEIIEVPASIEWPGGCNLIPLGSVPADSEGIFTFSGLANKNGVGETLVRLLDQVVDYNPGSCTHGSANQLAEVVLFHIGDKAPPSDVTILSPRTVIGQGMIQFTGSVADASPVPVITLEIKGARGTTQFDCPDETPGDGQWTCDWNIAASNGNVPPAEGSTFSIRARATDVFDKVSDWSPTLTLKVDATVPALTLAEGLLVADVLLTEVQPVIHGMLTDNSLVNGVEVCDASGGSCSPAEILIDPATIPATEWIVNDVPEATIPIPDSSEIDACTQALERTFTINETFKIANLQVGLNALHPYRGDLKVILQSPAGTQVTLMGETDNNRHNLDVLWSDFAWKLIDHDWLDHSPDSTAYQNTRRPLTPLRAFYGEQANGVWTLSVCDMYREDSGAYLSSRLMFNTDIPATNTQASWSYPLPEGLNLDNQSLTTTIYGVDESGNRSPLKSLTVRVDNVAPQLTVEQKASIAAIAGEIPVLQGAYQDGSPAYVFVIVQDPFGISTHENASQTDAGSWAFSLKPAEIGTYTLIPSAIDAAGNLTEGGKYTLEVIDSFRIYLPLTSSENNVGTIAGHVRTQDGAPMSGVTVMAGSLQATTALDGSYSITGPRGTYQVIPAKDGYSFTPVQRVVAVPPNAAAVDFIGAEGPIATPTPPVYCPNLLDNPGFETGVLGTGAEDGTQGWVFPLTSYRAGFSTSVVYAGSRSARVGISTPADDRYSYSSVWQRMDVPGDANQATISFNLSFYSTEAAHSISKTQTVGKDGQINSALVSGAQYVILYDADTGVKIMDLISPTWSNDSTWRSYSFTFQPGDAKYDLNLLKNKHVRLFFGVVNDTGGGVSAMYVDNASLTTCK